MRRKHRRRHLIIWIALAVLLPIVLVAAFSQRHTEPVNRSVPTLAK